MSTPTRSSSLRMVAILWILLGLAVGAVSWLLPINLGALTPALLHAAGQGTPSVSDSGQQWLEREKLGPAA
ncbi:MAG TPA: hypothetical protein PLN52_13000, partial [Opitutaceae bacterium]|nr:hypothetical protein [Opitutaceae bacterium]